MSVVGKMLGTAIVFAFSALQDGPGLCQSAAAAATAGTTASRAASTNLAFIEAPEIRLGNPTKQFPRGSRLVRIHIDAAGRGQGAPVALTEGMFAVADPQVSFDGRKILFAAQTERAAAWQIFEIPSDGGVAQQLTHCAADCVHPIYLPEKGIAYTALHGASAEWTSEVQVSRADGTDAHSITFGPGGFEAEIVLRSGRLLLSATSPLVAANGLRQPRALYVVDPDGSGLALLRQDVGLRAARGSVEELADGTIVFLKQETGQLMRLRPGALRAVPFAGLGVGYAAVHALADGTLVASRRGVGGQMDLYRISLDHYGPAQRIYRGLQVSSLQAVCIQARPMVLAYRSILHPERTSGRIVCLDAYASKDAATGRVAGHIARVRVLTKIQGGEKVLGEGPVELDGSFYATVPADLPIRLMLIGPNGKVLKQQRSWIWVRNGEDRGCYGCHESQARAPENRSPMTLQRMDTPTLLMGEASATIKPQKATQP